MTLPIDKKQWHLDQAASESPVVVEEQCMATGCEGHVYRVRIAGLENDRRQLRDALRAIANQEEFEPDQCQEIAKHALRKPMAAGKLRPYGTSVLTLSAAILGERVNGIRAGTLRGWGNKVKALEDANRRMLDEREDTADIMRVIRKAGRVSSAVYDRIVDWLIAHKIEA